MDTSVHTLPCSGAAAPSTDCVAVPVSGAAAWSVLGAAANQVLKLPASKYTVREREMLIGSGILPYEFFEAARNPFVIGFGMCECVGWERLCMGGGSMLGT